MTASQNEWATKRGTVALQMFATLGKTSGARAEEMKEDGKRIILLEEVIFTFSFLIKRVFSKSMSLPTKCPSFRGWCQIADDRVFELREVIPGSIDAWEPKN